MAQRSKDFDIWREDSIRRTQSFALFFVSTSGIFLAERSSAAQRSDHARTPRDRRYPDAWARKQGPQPAEAVR